MNSFFTTSGSSPPEGCRDHPAEHDLRPDQQENPTPLPEELVEALAALLAQALVNDIRQYPDLQDLTPAGAPVTAPPGMDARPQQAAGHRHIATRSRTRRPAHAS
jgi:hypothetical protein